VLLRSQALGPAEHPAAAVLSQGFSAGADASWPDLRLLGVALAAAAVNAVRRLLMPALNLTGAGQVQGQGQTQADRVLWLSHGLSLAVHLCMGLWAVRLLLARDAPDAASDASAGAAYALDRAWLGVPLSVCLPPLESLPPPPPLLALYAQARAGALTEELLYALSLARAGHAHGGEGVWRVLRRATAAALALLLYMADLPLLSALGEWL
jgi:hypothetical protein